MRPMAGSNSEFLMLMCPGPDSPSGGRGADNAQPPPPDHSLSSDTGRKQLLLSPEDFFMFAHIYHTCFHDVENRASLGGPGFCPSYKVSGQGVSRDLSLPLKFGPALTTCRHRSMPQFTTSFCGPTVSASCWGC